MVVEQSISILPIFGRDAKDACGELYRDIEVLNNPLPTGDHWKVVNWIKEFQQNKSFIAKLPIMRADFIKRAAQALDSRGAFCMMISNQFARKFRDDNGLRGARGHVFIIVKAINT